MKLTLKREETKSEKMRKESKERGNKKLKDWLGTEKKSFENSRRGLHKKKRWTSIKTLIPFATHITSMSLFAKERKKVVIQNSRMANSRLTNRV